MAYSPTIGRFMQLDPIGYDDGMNPYQFGHGNPEKYSDPEGTEAKQSTLPKESGTVPTPQGPNLPFKGKGEAIEVKVRITSDLSGVLHKAYGAPCGNTTAQALIDIIAKESQGRPIKWLVITSHGQPPDAGTTAEKDESAGKALYLYNPGDKDKDGNKIAPIGAPRPLTEINILTYNTMPAFAEELLKRVEFTADAEIELRACYTGSKDLAKILMEKIQRVVIAPTGDYKLNPLAPDEADMKAFKPGKTSKDGNK